MTRFPHTLDIESSIPVHITLPEYRAMRTPTRTTGMGRIIGLLATIVLCASLCALVTTPRAHASVTTTCTSAPVTYEDDPCWTWTRDGNGYRGVTTTRGSVRIVDACAFQRIDRARRIDWKATPRLRGDQLARQRGCAS